MKKKQVMSLALAAALAVTMAAPLCASAKETKYVQTSYKYYVPAVEEDGQPIPGKTKMTYAVFTKYNKSGKISTEVTKNEDNEVLNTIKYTYKKGKLKKMTSSSEGSKVITSYTYKNGKIKTEKNSTDGEINYIKTYTYKKGKLTKATYKNASGQVTNVDAYYANGNIKSQTLYDGKDVVEKVKYDKKGNQTSNTMYSDGKAHYKTTEKNSYTKKGVLSKVTEKIYSYNTDTGKLALDGTNVIKYYTTGYRKNHINTETSTYTDGEKYVTVHTYKKDKSGKNVGQEISKEKSTGYIYYKYVYTYKKVTV